MAGAILFLGANGLPYAIFLTKGFMDTVPMEIEESAWTEGAGVYRTLWSELRLLMRSGLAVATIFTFVGMWGNFFVPFMLLLSPENLPAAVTLYTFSSQYGQVAYGQLAAFSIFYSLPVVALYLFLGRSLGQGFAAAGGDRAWAAARGHRPSARSLAPGAADHYREQDARRLDEGDAP